MPKENFAFVTVVNAMCIHAKSILSHPTLCNPMDYNLPGSSVQGILQARILEWVAMSSSRGSSQPRDQINLPLCLLLWQVGSLQLEPQVLSKIISIFTDQTTYVQILNCLSLWVLRPNYSHRCGISTIYI